MRRGPRAGPAASSRPPAARCPDRPRPFGPGRAQSSPGRTAPRRRRARAACTGCPPIPRPRRARPPRRRREPSRATRRSPRRRRTAPRRRAAPRCRSRRPPRPSPALRAGPACPRAPRARATASRRPPPQASPSWRVDVSGELHRGDVTPCGHRPGHDGRSRSPWRRAGSSPRRRASRARRRTG